MRVPQAGAPAFRVLCEGWVFQRDSPERTNEGIYSKYAVIPAEPVSLRSKLTGEWRACPERTPSASEEESNGDLLFVAAAKQQVPRLRSG
jgi:hypothetical protein